VGLTRYDADGNEIFSQTLPGMVDKSSVVLFTSTEQAAAPNRVSDQGVPPVGGQVFHGYRSYVTLSELTPNGTVPPGGGAGSTGFDRLGVEAPPYDPYILVHQTGRDIHMIGKPALSGSSGVNSFINANGYPWVLIVPSDWAHPAEGAAIWDVYYHFNEWVASSGAAHADWYALEAGSADESRLVLPAYPPAQMIGPGKP
jgi:hypothetical protein